MNPIKTPSPIIENSSLAGITHDALLLAASVVYKLFGNSIYWILSTLDSLARFSIGKVTIPKPYPKFSYFPPKELIISFRFSGVFPDIIITSNRFSSPNIWE